MATNAKKKILANNVTPAFPVHPGSILGEELKARGLSQKKFAESVGLQATHLSAIIHGTRNFTAAVAAKIASGLDGISADIWMKLQERYNKDVKRNSVNTSRLVFGYTADYPELKPACLAQPKELEEGDIQVTLSVPESDIELLENMASRLGWQFR